MSMKCREQSDRRPDVFLSGKNIDLRVLTVEDVEQSGWYDWFNDESTCLNLQKHYYPNTRALQREFYDEMQHDTSKVQLGITPKGLDNLAGVVSLSGIDFINRNAEFSLVIGDEQFRRTGHSSEALKLIFEHGFLTMNLHKVYGGMLAPLAPWVKRITQEFGLIPEGIWKDHVFKNGRFVDVIRVGLMRSDFEKYLSDLGEWPC